jgi:hypothetical protein
MNIPRVLNNLHAINKLYYLNLVTGGNNDITEIVRKTEREFKDVESAKARLEELTKLYGLTGANTLTSDQIKKLLAVILVIDNWDNSDNNANNANKPNSNVGLERILPHLAKLSGSADSEKLKKVLANILNNVIKRYEERGLIEYMSENQKLMALIGTKSGGLEKIDFKWKELKKQDIEPEKFFDLSCKKDKTGFRCEFVNELIRFLQDSYCPQCVVTPTGSVGSTPGSDYDLTMTGPTSVQILKLFDNIVKQMFGASSSDVFDTNLYTVGFIMILGPEVVGHMVYNSEHFTRLEFAPKNFIYIEPTNYTWGTQMDWAKMKLTYWLIKNGLDYRTVDPDGKLSQKISTLLGSTDIVNSVAPNVDRYAECMEEFNRFDTHRFKDDFNKMLDQILSGGQLDSKIQPGSDIGKMIQVVMTDPNMKNMFDIESVNEEIKSLSEKLSAKLFYVMEKNKGESIDKKEYVTGIKTAIRNILINEYDDILKNRLTGMISKICFYGDETYWSIGTFYHIVGFAYTFGSGIKRSDVDSDVDSDPLNLPHYYVAKDSDNQPMSQALTKFIDDVSTPECFACSMIENLGDVMKELTHKSEHKWIDLSKYLMRYYDAMACYYAIKNDIHKSYEAEIMYKTFKFVKDNIRGYPDAEYAERNMVQKGDSRVQKFKALTMKELDTYLADSLNYLNDSQFANHMLSSTLDAINTAI